MLLLSSHNGDQREKREAKYSRGINAVSRQPEKKTQVGQSSPAQVTHERFDGCGSVGCELWQMIRVVEKVRIYSKLNNQVSPFGGVCTFCLPNSVLLIEAISKVMTDWRHLWQPVYRAPLARYFVWH